ncbi:MAG: hypothetical protein DRJ42_15785 [Deltaproteobacteria bacterium]|nr:MAG: hypothetical protein DRJ42_15785 [Deltaproteobacteria bacterium]
MTAARDLEGFERLASGDSSAFREARLVVHWLAQLPSAAGASLAPAMDDFSHTSLSWLAEQELLAGVVLPDERRAALDVGGLRLLVLAADGTVAGEMALRGATLDEARSWLGGELGGEVKLPEHELPVHPIGEGAPVPDVATSDLNDLARWFGNAARVLDQVTALHEHAAEVRCWPHHFDIATLISLDPAGATDAEEARSVGVGMTPGDGGVSVPYFYITPWPYPPADQLPKLEGGGHWNTEGWVGALLRGDELHGDAATQRDQVAAFVTSAVSASLTLLSVGTV